MATKQFRKSTIDGELYVNAKDVTRELGIRVQNVYKWSDQRESVQVTETYIPAKSIPEKHRMTLGIDIPDATVEEEPQTIESSELIPIGQVMKECGLKSKDHGRYFAEYAKDKSRRPMTLTSEEANKMIYDYTGQTDINETAPSQVTIEEVTEPKKTLTVDEVMDVLKMMLMRY